MADCQQETFTSGELKFGNEIEKSLILGPRRVGVFMIFQPANQIFQLSGVHF